MERGESEESREDPGEFDGTLDTVARKEMREAALSDTKKVPPVDEEGVAVGASKVDEGEEERTAEVVPKVVATLEALPGKVVCEGRALKEKSREGPAVGLHESRKLEERKALRVPCLTEVCDETKEGEDPGDEEGRTEGKGMLGTAEVVRAAALLNELKGRETEGRGLWDEATETESRAVGVASEKGLLELICVERGVSVGSEEAVPRMVWVNWGVVVGEEGRVREARALGV